MKLISFIIFFALSLNALALNKVDEVQLVSGKNYITNGGGEQGKAGWVRYADAAATSPVDGTAGSPNASTTITTTSSTPLAGAYSLLLTKDAVNRQGEGVSYAFSIDSGNQAKMLSLSFMYNSSANFAVSSGASGSESDVEVWIYDVTNSVLIPISPYKLTAQPLQNGLFQGTFQTASNSTSYRLIFHIATTNASAWTLKFDNVSVSRQPILFGAPVTDEVTWTPTLTGMGSATSVTFASKRVGDRLQVRGSFTAGTTTATQARISLGYNGTDSNVTSSSAIASGTQDCGWWTSTQNGIHGSILCGQSQTYVTMGLVGASNAGYSNVLASAAISTGASVTLFFEVPITGWSSSVQMSQDTDTRVVTARMNYAGSAYTLGNSSQATVKFDTVDFDTHGALTTGASPLFTVPVPGYYKVDADYEFATNATGQRAISLYKNGAQVSEINQTGNPSGTNGNRLHGTDTIKCVAGDTLAIFAFQSSGGNLNIGGSGSPYNYATFTRVSGPSAIAVTETVAARGTNTAGTSINSATDTLLPVVVDYDTHGALSTSGTFTAPVSGKYAMKGCVSYNDAVGSGDLINLKFKKNASTVISDMPYVVPTAGTNQFGGCASDTVRLLAGDTAGMYVAQNSGAGRVLGTGTGRNFFTIERIGSY